MRTLSYAGRTKKSWWEKGTKKSWRDAVWDPWDLDPGLQLHTAEHHARDEERAPPLDTEGQVLDQEHPSWCDLQHEALVH